jgi:cytochrome P450
MIGGEAGMPQRTVADPRDIDSLNLADPSTHAEYDLSDAWKWLRRNRPVYWHRAVGSSPGFWVVSRHKDVSDIYADRRFTSEKGNVIQTLLTGGDSAAGMMAAVTDGPRHSEIRSIIMKGFSPRSLKGISDSLRKEIGKLLAKAMEMGQVNFSREVASSIPLIAVCELMNVPESDREHILSLAKSTLTSDRSNQTPAEAWRAKNDILAYFGKLADDRRKNPGSDVVSALTQGAIGGKPLTMDEIVVNCYSLILGGDHSTRAAISGAVLALIENPSQWSLLKSGDVEIASAVEEVLRWTTPAMHFGRRALEDVSIAGQTIRRGDIVTLWNSSANKDEAVFSDPDKFILRRASNKHIAFGHGPHFCLGAYLARAEIAVMLTELKARVRDMSIAGPVIWEYSTIVNGISDLPVVLNAD